MLARALPSVADGVGPVGAEVEVRRCGVVTGRTTIFQAQVASSTTTRSCSPDRLGREHGGVDLRLAQRAGPERAGAPVRGAASGSVWATARLAVGPSRRRGRDEREGERGGKRAHGVTARNAARDKGGERRFPVQGFTAAGEGRPGVIPRCGREHGDDPPAQPSAAMPAPSRAPSARPPGRATGTPPPARPRAARGRPTPTDRRRPPPAGQADAGPSGPRGLLIVAVTAQTTSVTTRPSRQYERRSAVG